MFNFTVINENTNSLERVNIKNWASLKEFVTSNSWTSILYDDFEKFASAETVVIPIINSSLSRLIERFNGYKCLILRAKCCYNSFFVMLFLERPITCEYDHRRLLTTCYMEFMDVHPFNFDSLTTVDFNAKIVFENKVGNLIMLKQKEPIKFYPMVVQNTSFLRRMHKFFRFIYRQVKKGIGVNI